MGSSLLFTRDIFYIWGSENLKIKNHMKKLLLTGIALSVVVFANAQNRPAASSSILNRLQNIGTQTPVPYQEPTSGDELPTNKVNSTVVNHRTGTVNKSSMAQVIIGTSTYDLQSNGSIQNRIYQENGTVGAAWTMSFSTDAAGSYTDRGTGYNYYDGTAWGLLPTTRIETDRRGWPSLTKLANGSELVVSHQSVNLTTSTNSRPAAGSGTWTQTQNPNFPGGEKSLWARTAAGGPDGNTVHMIDISYPVANGGTLVNGLDGALSYSRSLDGGVTWDIVRIMLPGVNDIEYDGFRADGYAIDAKDNNVVITAGDIDADWCYWKSTDNGTTWTRSIIQDFPFTKYDDTVSLTDVDGDGVADTVLTTDGSYAVLLDNNGMIHAWAGAMLILDTDPAALLGLFLSTDGLLYWNESMGTNLPVVVATAPDIDGSGQADDFAADLGGRFGNDGICSMPSAGIDAAGNIYLSYCPLMEGTDSGNPTPLAFSYRNVYLQASMDGGATWGTPINVSNSNYDEAVFCAMAKNVSSTCASMIWQQDGSPGYAVPPNGEHGIGNNDIIYDCVDVALVLGVSNELTSDVSVSVFPNPASNNVMLNYTVENATEMTIEIRNIMGQVVETFVRNIQSAGIHSVNVNVENYNSGVYTVNTIMGDKAFSTKFVKN